MPSKFNMCIYYELLIMQVVIMRICIPLFLLITSFISSMHAYAINKINKRGISSPNNASETHVFRILFRIYAVF